MEDKVTLGGPMGKQKVVDKTIRLQTTLTALTPALVTAGQVVGLLGSLPIGQYKGAAAFWDLNLAVNEPNVLAEQLHILDNIDGAGVDGIVNVTMPAAAGLGTVVVGTITVPAGEVWFINAVTQTCAADATGTVTWNWRCSLFPDALGNALGGTYHTADLATALAPQVDEFSAIAVVFGVGNKPVALRLPAGTTISGQLTVTVLAITGVVGTLALNGWKGRPLVA